MNQPFLFKFKQHCSTKNEFQENFVYDATIDMVVSKIENLKPVIHCSGTNLPETKKADLEKGEDFKDTLMW